MEENLKELIRLFYEDKKQLDSYKKSSEDLNQQVKDLMKQLNVTEFEANNLKAKMSIQKRESFNEDALIAKLKSLGGMAVRYKEYVDMDVLEDLIYNGVINASDLSDCKIVKEVTTLKVSEKKVK